MASKSIKGITIEIGGDTTKLGTALADVNKKSYALQGELRQVEKLLKLDPTNTELLAQKQKILAEQVNNSADKMKILKKAQDQVKKQFENGEIDEGQYRAFQRELQKTEMELKDVKDDSNRAEKEVKELGNTSEKTSNKMETLKKVAGGVATAFKAVVAVGGATISAIGAVAYKAGQSADEINTLSKQTGLATEDIQKFQYATDLIDVDLETLTGSLKKLTNNMDSARSGTGSQAEAFAKLGISVTDANGNLRDNQEVFYETLDALGQISNATERDAISMDIFGKSAQDLNPLIMGGAEQLKEMGDQAEKLGLILDQETLDSANAFNDVLDTMKATGSSAFKVLGSSIATDLTPALQTANGMLNDLVQNLISGYKDNGVEGLVGAVGDSLSSIVTTIVEYAPQVINVALTLIQSLLDGIQSNLPIITQGAVQVVSTLITSILDMLPQILQMGIDVIVQLALGIANALPTLIPQAIECILTLAETLLDNIDMIIDAGIQLLIGLADGLITALPRLIERIPTIIDKLVTALVDNAPKLFEASIQLIVMLAKGIIENLPQLLAKIPQIIVSIVKGFISYMGNVKEIGSNLLNGIWDGISGAFSGFMDKVKGIGSKIVGGIKDIFGIHSPSTIMRDEVGKYLSDGIALGISENSNAPLEATDGVLNDITKEVNGINLDKSINRTFNDEVNTSIGSTGVVSANNAQSTPLTIILQYKDLVLGKAVINDLKELTKINGSNPVLSI